MEFIITINNPPIKKMKKKEEYIQQRVKKTI